MNNDDEVYEEDDSIIDFDYFNREKTPEEIAEEKRKQAEELKEKGFLPKNEELDETPHSSQEDVEKNPKKYIIEECIPACQELWRKNIYTFMVSDHLNEGMCWIEVVFDSLSDENKKILKELSGEDIIKFSYHKGCANFGVKQVGKRGQERLKELAEHFKMQDVPMDIAYVSTDKFLFEYCGCYDEKANPNYVNMLHPNVFSPEAIKEYVDWLDSDRSKKTIRVYNPNKRQKPIEELVKEHGMIFEKKDGRIYLSPFHFKKHQEYEKYIESQHQDL